MTHTSETDIVIVGAGAAGIGAARTLTELGKNFVWLEASHRVGGRGYTEEILPGVPFDLGCHWMHSASLNPMVGFADKLGFTYTKDGYPRGGFFEGRWQTAEEIADFGVFYDRQFQMMQKAAETQGDCSVYDATDREHKWSALFNYYTSLDASHDVDQVSVSDLLIYNETDENWPLKEGYGTLLARLCGQIPVSLNSAVNIIDWSGRTVKVETAKGTIRAQKVLITVSTGILAAGDIRFDPGLPDWKQEAIAALPLGNHNRICIGFDRDVFGADAPAGFTTDAVDGNNFAMNIKPFGANFATGLTGGRFADWLEQVGQQASLDYMEQKLKAVFGSEITKHASTHIVTAWRGDPWIKGAYAGALPGQHHQRRKLFEPLDERIYFAGEATSPDFFTTAHGAFLSGIVAVEMMIET